jgi:DNA-binding transcriptional ArsR family regulator
MHDMLNNYRRILWYVFATTRGGPARIRILDLLIERPYNMNQLSTKLGADYKTIQHHIKILEDNKVITADEKKYGTIYFPSQYFEQTKATFGEIKEKMGGKNNAMAGRHSARIGRR